jgi:hypothetical protein
LLLLLLLLLALSLSFLPTPLLLAVAVAAVNAFAALMSLLCQCLLFSLSSPFSLSLPPAPVTVFAFAHHSFLLSIFALCLLPSMSSLFSLSSLFTLSLPPFPITCLLLLSGGSTVTAPLATISEDDYCMPNQDDSWQCLCCNQTFKPKHATRAAAHFAKRTKMGIKACSAAVSADDLKCYIDLFESIVCGPNTRKHGSDELFERSAHLQDSAIISLIANKVDNLPSSLSSMSAISALSVDSPKETVVLNVLSTHISITSASLMSAQQLMPVSRRPLLT